VENVMPDHVPEAKLTGLFLDAVTLHDKKYVPWCKSALRLICDCCGLISIPSPPTPIRREAKGITKDAHGSGMPVEKDYTVAKVCMDQGWPAIMFRVSQVRLVSTQRKGVGKSTATSSSFLHFP